MIRIFNSGLIVCFLVGCLSSVSKAGPSEVSGIEGASAKYAHSFTSDTLKIKEEYRTNISSLASDLKKEGIDIDSLLSSSEFNLYEGIGDRFRKSAERKSVDFSQYKKILGFDYKKEDITPFINAHAAQLQKAEDTYSISKYVIAAILGVESDFGKNIGSHNPFNTYVSMVAVNYRKDFAKAQLKELLKFTSRKNIDVFELKSSYAGAMSYGQFIPYSINKWFVGDDIFDMDNNIMSIANYLAYFKKRTKSMEKAVLRYNPSSLYVQAIMELAREAEKISSSAP